MMDGIKNHLWKALKTAVQTWFNEKLESLLGLGKSVLEPAHQGRDQHGPGRQDGVRRRSRPRSRRR